MKKLSLLILTQLLLIPSVSSQIHTVNNVVYLIEDNKAIVKYMDPIAEADTGDLIVPESITIDTQIYPVKVISKNAFKYSGFTSIVLPNTIDSIGIDAFSYCIKLERVTLPNSLTIIPKGLFLGSTSLKHIDIPSSVTKIQDYAFSKCTKLDTICIPDKCVSIGDYCFSGCFNLRKITYGTSIEAIGYNVCEKTYQITEITIKATNPPKIKYTIDYILHDKTLRVPQDAVGLYKRDSQWGTMNVVGI